MPITDKKISAIVTCYKDGPAIAIMLERLHRTLSGITPNYEIIYVNDASPDNAEEILKEIATRDKRLIVINHSRNFGSQNAFTSGMAVATGDAVTVMDGDLQDPPEVIAEFAAKWLEGYDVVYGIRKKREGSRIFNVFYKIFYRLFRKLSYVQIPVDAGDFSLMDRKVVNALNSLPETDRFIRGLRAWVGFKQTGIEYFRPERMFGRTTNSFLKNIRWAKKGIFSFSFEPLEMIFYLSIIVFILSLAGIIFYFISYFIYPDQPRGITTIIILILFLSSVQLLSLSVIGEYLAKIFEETKRRPKYIVKSIINKPEGK
jgi:polyisoprenyl-phosphate glycosyltransferase